MRGCERPLQRYREVLRSIPASGSGCHPFLLKVANYGVFAGVERDRLIEDVCSAIPDGSRRVSIREVENAVDKALSATRPNAANPESHSYRKRRKPPSVDPKVYFNTALDHASRAYNLVEYEASLWESSPIRMDWPPEYDAAWFIRHMYRPRDYVFIGERYARGNIGTTIRTAEHWVEYLIGGGHGAPHIIANPLTGNMGKSKTGKETLRGDDCVTDYRYAIVEFDDIPKHEQAAFLYFADLPICAIIDSGGKSLHAWVKVDALSEEEWTQRVEDELFGQLLRPLGVDSACKNESRMSRLPGHVRENGNRQRLLYLAPEGRALSR